MFLEVTLKNNEPKSLNNASARLAVPKPSCSPAGRSLHRASVQIVFGVTPNVSEIPTHL
jgi:hypothetical protein